MSFTEEPASGDRVSRSNALKRASALSELPSEIAIIILSHLDTPSIYALSNSCGYWSRQISDSAFEKEMHRICPWFEPETSNFASFKGCYGEYLRRVYGGRFLTSLKVIESEMEASGSQNEWIDGFIGSHSNLSTTDYVSKLKEVPLREFHNDIYTSKYGINVNLKKLNMWSAPDFQRILSVPQFFAAIIGHRCTQYVVGQLLVQRQEEKLPRIYELPDCQDYEMVHSGRHLFVHIIRDDENVLGWPNVYDSLMYVSESGLKKVMDLRDINKAVSVYNGTFHYFSHHHCAVQTDIDGFFHTDRTPNQYGIESVRDIGEDGAVLYSSEGTSYIWDKSQGTLLPTSSYRLETSDVPIFLNVPYPGIDSVDLEMAEAQGEDPIEPEHVPFALFASLHHLAGRLVSLEDLRF